MKGRHQRHAEHLAQLLDRLRAKLQGEVAAVVQINDFDDFAQRLGQLQGDVNTESLARLFDAEAPLHEIGQERLQRISTLLHNLEAQHRLYSSGRRSRLMLALHPDISLWSGFYPDNPHANPWMSHGREDTPALAAGLFDGITAVLAKEFVSCRLAELEIRDAFNPDEALGRLDWRDFTEDELKLVPPVLMVAPAQAIHWHDLGPLLGGSRPIQVALLDAEGPGDDTAEDHALLALDQHRASVLQSSIGYPEHLLEGAATGLEHKRPALFAVYAPDPEHCGIAAEQVVNNARLAVDTRVVPLFHFDPDSGALEIRDNSDDQDDWGQHSLTVRDSQGGLSELENRLTPADWAVGQSRFRHQFRIIGKGHLNGQMRPLPQYLALDPAQREGLEPYIDVVDDKQRHFLATVSAQMTNMTESALSRWRRLQRTAGQALSTVVEAEVPTGADSSRPAAEPVVSKQPAADTHQALVEQLLAMSGYGSDGEFHNQSLRRFLESREQSDQVTELE
jgi:pyruvate-ferredoxin/flavodoxin oxidoreductase